MAIDKSRTTPFMKAVIIFICVAFFVGVASTAVMGILSGVQVSQQAATGTAPGGQATTQTIDAIALKHTPLIKSREASLAADPGNYELNVLQGQEYFDWAAEVMQSTQGKQGEDLWTAAVPFYQAALKTRPGDPNVTTDYSIALYYSGETTTAISVVEQVITGNPSFAPARFNAGIFYQAAGDNMKAKAAWEKYLQLEPNGAQADAAKNLLGSLK